MQYYFHTKEQLLFAGLRHAIDLVGRRATTEVQATAAPTVRDGLYTLLTQLIPADDEQRASYTVLAAFHALALTEPALAELPYTRGSSGLENVIGDRIKEAQHAGEVSRARDADAEAANLLALTTGLGNSVMAKMRTLEEAISLLSYHLGQLFDTGQVAVAGGTSFRAV